MPFYCQNPGQRRELGPFEERVVIGKLIDGEVNARTFMRTSPGGRGALLSDSDFGATLGKLTARWRRNILDLQFESLWYYLALAFTVAVPLIFVCGLHWDAEAFATFESGIYFTLLFLAGGLVAQYFRWLYLYRMWRVVPKSYQHIPPGWRIMLGYVPFFRLGWNFALYLPLARHLRELTNFTRYTGFGAAIVYCVTNILASLGFWAMLLLPYPWSIGETVSEKTPHYYGLIGSAMWVAFLIFLAVMLFSEIVMLERLKAAALLVLRRRFAYNLPMHEVEAPFMLQVLKSFRRSDAVHRWGHGIGIASVMIGSPLLLVALPIFILTVVGSCRYEESLADLQSTCAVSGQLPAGSAEVRKNAALATNASFRTNSWESLSRMVDADRTPYARAWGYLYLKAPTGFFYMARYNRLARAYIEAAARKDEAAARDAEKKDDLSEADWFRALFRENMRAVRRGTSR